MPESKTKSQKQIEFEKQAEYEKSKSDLVQVIGYSKKVYDVLMQIKEIQTQMNAVFDSTSSESVKLNKFSKLKNKLDSTLNVGLMIKQ